MFAEHAGTRRWKQIIARSHNRDKAEVFLNMIYLVFYLMIVPVIIIKDSSLVFFYTFRSP